MKAIKTRHFIEEALRQILGVSKHLRTLEIIFDHEQDSLKELNEFERLAFIGQAIELAVNTKHDFIYVGDENNPFGYDNANITKDDLERLLGRYEGFIQDVLEQMEVDDDATRES